MSFGDRPPGSFPSVPLQPFGHLSVMRALSCASATLNVVIAGACYSQPTEHLGERRTALSAATSKSWHSLGLVARSLLPLRFQRVEDWRMEVL
jgi:hypothetical protein